MPTLALASELTLATVSSHFPNSVRRQSSLAAAAPGVGVERIQGRNAAINRHDSSESDIEGGARGRTSIRRRFRRKGHRSFGNLGLAGGRRPRLLTVPTALSTPSLRTSASPPPAGPPSRNAWAPASRRQQRPPGAGVKKAQGTLDLRAGGQAVYVGGTNVNSELVSRGF